MHAVIQTGGKQYRVTQGDVIRVELLPGEVGQSIDFDKILMISDDTNQTVGAPYIAGAKVTGEILERARAKKIHILKFHRRKHHMKRQGHRQGYIAVKITDIKA